MVVLAAAAVAAGCGGHTRDRASTTGATTTVPVFSGTGRLYPKHLHQPPTDNN